MAPKSAKTPRKRPRQPRSQATYAAVLEAAARILEEGGVDAANTNAIAARAGVSVGSLYQYFPDKEAIFAELIRMTETQTANAVEALVDGTAGMDFRQRVKTLVSAGVGQQFERPKLARVLDYIEASMPADPVCEDAEVRIMGAVERLLRDHRQFHLRRAYGEAAQDLLAIVKGMVDAASVANEADIRQIEKRVTWAVLGYLSAK